MTREAMNSKVIVLGIDGMDPRLTKHYLDEGKLPNIAEFVRRGAAREDLSMVGALPTITPPMWTTLATGAYPGTHGITCFWNQDHKNLANMVYSLDSTLCQAEQVWNVTAEADLKTMVWHWPGSSWPPTSQSPNLSVVDGTQPGFVNFGVAAVEEDVLTTADEAIAELTFISGGGHANTGAGCIISDLEVKDELGGLEAMNKSCDGMGVENVMFTLEDGEYALELAPFDMVNSPIKEAHGWADAPKGAKEFTVLLSQGLLRRPVLILPNAQGEYEQVAIYRNKKDTTPLCTLKVGEMTGPIIDKSVKSDGTEVEAVRGYKLLMLNSEGTHLAFWAGRALERYNDTVWHPKSLCQEIIDNVGYTLTGSSLGGINPYFTRELMLPTWEIYNTWQADCLNYLVETGRYDVIFSHLHNVDGIGHNVWTQAMYHPHLEKDNTVVNLQYMEDTYTQTDRYLGRFLHLLDEGWTVFIVSDHGLIAGEEDHPPLLGDPYGVNVSIMRELGFTEVKKDSQGQDLKEIDWSKTKAVAVRTCHIWINLKGRDAYGIVEPEDKYQVEQEVIDGLYNYRDPATGRRVISLALRNKDAVLLGLRGYECGDIVYWLEEGFTRVHGDSLSTQTGGAHTSVSPIFIAAGAAIKENYVTSRDIRQVDVAPTLAAVLGVRMPEQNEGSVVHQILAKDF